LVLVSPCVGTGDVCDLFARQGMDHRNPRLGAQLRYCGDAQGHYHRLDRIVIFNIAVIPGLPTGGLLVSMLGVATICGFVYIRTRSGLVVLVLQATFNSSLLIFPVTPTSGGIPTFCAFSAFYFVAALLHGIIGPRPYFQREFRLIRKSQRHPDRGFQIRRYAPRERVIHGVVASSHRAEDGGNTRPGTRRHSFPRTDS
jgi:hypothetical protein